MTSVPPLLQEHPLVSECAWNNGGVAGTTTSLCTFDENKLWLIYIEQS